ncbi:Ig-like domain-containing protein [Citrobacter amalonaticus]|nr:Ig-like domain-containing protein [Citrobacter amalonaticus]
MLADGTDTRTVTATLRDVRGNALRNQPVSFTVSGGPAFSGETSGITGDDGTVTVTLTSTVAGTFTVSGAASDLSLNGSADVTFTITGPYRGTIELSESSATADGSSTVTLTVKLTDAKGNLVSNEGSIYAGSRRGLTNIPSIASGGSMAMTEESQGIYTIEILTGTTVGEEDFWVVQASSFSEGRTPMVDNLVTLELTAGELHSGTIALSGSSVEAGGSSTVTLTVKLKDINGNLVSNEGSVYVGSRNGLTNIPSIASGGSRAMTEDPDSPGVYTINIQPGTTAGTDDFWVVQASSFPGRTGVMTNNSVALELTAGELHSGTIALSGSSVEAGGSSTVTLTVKLKDINGNLVSNEGSVYVGSRNGLTNIPSIASGGSRAMTEDPDSPGVYTINIQPGTTAGTDDFWVVQASSFPGRTGVMTNNSVSLELIALPPTSAIVNAWWSYQGGSNGSTYRTFSSAVRFENSAGNSMQCDSVAVSGNSEIGYAANANTTMANRHTFAAYNWSNDSYTYNAETKVYSFTKDISIGSGGAGYTYNVVLAASGETTSPVVGWGFLGGEDILTVSCKVGSTTYSFKTSNGMTVNSSLGI